MPAKVPVLHRRLRPRWRQAYNRCYNPKDHYYPSYGGRGIKFCERWLIFDNFLKDMGGTYREGLSIDRIDNNGNYEPSNCRWTTPKIQARNRRNARYLTLDGTTKLIVEWCDHYGISYKVVHDRLRKGFTPRQALELPRYHHRGSHYATT